METSVKWLDKIFLETNGSGFNRAHYIFTSAPWGAFRLSVYWIWLLFLKESTCFWFLSNASMTLAEPCVTKWVSEDTTVYVRILHLAPSYLKVNIGMCAQKHVALLVSVKLCQSLLRLVLRKSSNASGKSQHPSYQNEKVNIVGW